MKIKIGEYEVLHDGTIIGNEDEPIDFIFIKEIGFIIRIIFANDLEKSEPHLKAESFDASGAAITFYNFNNPMGTGNINPTLIGSLNNRELFLNYRIHAIERGGKTFHYTWFLGKEVKK